MRLCRTQQCQVIAAQKRRPLPIHGGRVSVLLSSPVPPHARAVVVQPVCALIPRCPPLRRFDSQLPVALMVVSLAMMNLRL